MTRLLQRSFYTALVVLYSVVFAELFLRALDPQPLVPRYVTRGSGGIRANIPNVSFRQWTPEVDVVVRYNSAGMRDDRPPPPFQESGPRCRIALVGDSYFVGFESNFQDSFAHQLEIKLAAQGRYVRVLDFAVSGFGTAEMLKSIEARVEAWKPAIVLMSWHASDAEDNVRSGLYRVSQSALVPYNKNYLPGVAISDVLVRQSWYRWLIENSQLYSASQETIGRAIKSALAWTRSVVMKSYAAQAATRDAAGDLGVANSRSSGSYRIDRELNVLLVEKARAVTEAFGGHLMLMDVPFPKDRTHFISAIDTLLQPRPSVETISPIEMFRLMASPSKKLYWEKGHKHWTPLGNSIAATNAADHIVKDGFVDHCTRLANHGIASALQR